jgi:hypothetical protein
MKNILTVDLESWIHAYKEAVQDKSNIDSLNSADRKKLDDDHTCRATRNLLNLLDRYGQYATFFTSGELYEWYPDLIDEIERRGHEIGYHTQYHPSRIPGASALEKELKESGSFLERFKPLGFRAPQMYITRDSMARLKQWGFRYSSSTYGDYCIHRIEGIYEIPVTSLAFRNTDRNMQNLPNHITMKMLLSSIPFGSGLFISLLGSQTSCFINYFNKRNKPAVLMVHPWQLYKHDKFKGISFILNMLVKNILWTPYSFPVLKGFEKLLNNHEFTSFKESSAVKGLLVL